MKKLLFTAFGALLSISTMAQLSLGSTGMTYTITFDTTYSGVNDSIYTGVGLDTLPTGGMLDSDAWLVTGFSSGNTKFGDLNLTTGDYAKGISTGGVFSGGMYSYDVDTSSGTNYAFGIQPTGSDWTPGTVVLRIQNNTSSTLDSAVLSYDLWINNDGDRGNSVNPSYSTDNTNYTDLTSAFDTTPGTSVSMVTWVKRAKSVTFSGFSVASGGYLYIRWSGSDQTGSGNRDEIAIDDISITAYGSSTPPPPPPMIPNYPIGTVTTNDTSGVADSLGVDCSITGVVYGVDMAGTSSSNNSFTVIDATGGIALFKFSGFTPSYTVTEGDSVMVYGSISQFNGLTQMSPDSMKVLGSNAALKMPTLVTALGENTESDLIRIDSVQVITASQWPSSGSNANVDILTTGGDTLTLRIDRDTDVDDSISVAPVGYFNVIGIGGQFDSSIPHTSGYQILPRYRSDVMAASSPPPPPPSSIPHYPIGLVTTNDANGVADSLNVACAISGVVHGIDMSGLSSNSNTLQLFDATGGIQMYKSGGFTPSYVVNESDSVTLYGKIGQFNGLTQFEPDSIKVHSTGAMTRMWTKVSSLGENTESEYIRIDSVVLIDASQWPAMGSNANVQIETQAGDTLTMRIDKDSYVDDSVAAPAGLFDVIGYGGQFDFSSPYDAGYQILPQLKTDIIVYPASSCNDPDSLDAINISDVSADLAWKTGGSNTWNIEYGAPGFSLGSGTQLTVTTNPYTLAGLTANTSYEFYVQDSCVGFGSSNWVGPKAFTTLAGPKPIPTYTIAEVRGNDANGEPDSIDVVCWLHGTVFTGNFFSNGLSFYMMDETAGINVFNFNSVSNYTVNDGDSLKIKGKIQFYNGLTELEVDSIIVLDTNISYRGPQVVTTFDESTESEFIEIKDVVIADTSQWPAPGNNSNVGIITPSGDTLTMRIDLDTDVDDMWPTPPLDTFTVRGVGSQFDQNSPYDDGYQIFPRWYTDIDTTTTPVIPDNVVELDPSGETPLIAYPNPNSGNEVWFNKTINVTVRNMTGQVVKQARDTSSINIAELIDGMYLIESDTGEVIRLIVQ